MNDSVNHPSHYTQWPIEAITLAEREGFLYGNVLKYALRAGAKPGAPYEEDIAKAAWYAARLVTRMAKVTSVDDSLRALRKRGDSTLRYLASRQEDTAEMCDHLRTQLAIIYDQAGREVRQTWDAT